MKQACAWFENHRNAYIWPWLLQDYETCMRLKTKTQVRHVGRSRQGFPASDTHPVHSMCPLWGFSTISLDAGAGQPPSSRGLTRWLGGRSTGGRGVRGTEVHAVTRRWQDSLFLLTSLGDMAT